MDHIEISKELSAFIEESPSMFHTVEAVRKRLDAAGFRYLPETEQWDIEEGDRCYTVRNGSSIIAFRAGRSASGENYSFRICASHSDSPSYKVKAVPELEGPGEYLRLNVEGYGGMIDSSWFDRPLSVAGRILVRDCARPHRILTKLVYIDKDILIIPNVAIHFNREINTGYKYNRQIDLCPLFSAGALKKGAFDEMIAERLDIDSEDILGKDMFLVNRQKPSLWGHDGEFISAPKMDDLQCAFASLRAFIDAENDSGINVYCCFDNEEVGSNTKQGAMSTFLRDVLMRINERLGKTGEEYRRAVAGSFLVSCDNAHAVHPNHPGKTDDVNRAFMNKGIVIKESANQKYTTDAFSRAVFEELCREADIPVQTFANRSDSAGGSTLGNISNMQVSLHSVDIGLAQLAMHSSYETAGAMDTGYAIEGLKKFYETDILIEGMEAELGR